MIAMMVLSLGLTIGFALGALKPTDLGPTSRELWGHGKFQNLPRGFSNASKIENLWTRSSGTEEVPYGLNAELVRCQSKKLQNEVLLTEWLRCSKVKLHIRGAQATLCDISWQGTLPKEKEYSQ